MKPILFTLIMLISALAEAQTTEILDTIYANDTKNVALFFPEPIRQGITGSENFVFTYNREKEQYFGLLQAQPGKESNLLVINRNGSIFSYIVRYEAQLSKLNYFVPLSNSIGNEKPKLADSIQTKTSEKSIDNDTYYYQKFCSYLSIETRQKGKKKSLQRLYQEPIFKHHLPSKIAVNETVRFIYIMPKFSLSNDRRVILELNEKAGERNI